MKGNRIVVHALINYKGKYLVAKRSLNETAAPGYWDIPGGLMVNCHRMLLLENVLKK